MTADLAYATIQEIRGPLDRREISSVELTRDQLARIETLQPAVRAYLASDSQYALLQAEAADKRLALGERAPLLGMPMALKDILSTEGLTTTCGSRILENYIPQYSASAVERLHGAGAVLLGKTNLDEFAMGSSTENSAFFPTRNPWDLTRVPGGSSGGSAAAVASGQAYFALGTDTGGSIRQPAAFNGVVGLKPTYGRVSRYGLVAFASSLDQIGPFARCVWDVAAVLEVIAGHDPLDSTSFRAPVPQFANELTGELRGMRIGVPREYFGDGIDPGVRRTIEEALESLANLGGELIDVSLPHTEYALSTYYVISPAEAMANLARYDGVRYGISAPAGDVWDLFKDTRDAGFGREVKRRILLGAYVLSSGYYDAYYLRAQRVRTLVRQDFERAFEQVDVLASPTTPTVAFGLGEKVNDPLQMYLSDVYTVPANVAGIPGISVSAGQVDGLPVGLQILGKPLDEMSILQVAYAFEQATNFHRVHPSLEVQAITR
ncbi:MAG: Asp-tRNA(Asn)/Glu-tRNA(Gln) amidotransferase subunit GatA [Chloroflexota bacterium]